MLSSHRATFRVVGCFLALAAAAFAKENRLISRPIAAATVDELVKHPMVRFVSPAGKSGNPGSIDAPWDFTSAVEGQQKVLPGMTIYVLGGTYRFPDRSTKSPGFSIRLAGTEEQPVHLAALPGQRATVDGFAQVVAPADWLYLWNLEFTVTETAKWDRRSAHGGDPLPDNPYVPGGLNINTGKGCKYIHLVVHDSPGTGIGFWRTATDSEIHGCLIYNNGSVGPDRHHGPGIYTQNQTGEKFITGCMIFANYSTTIQAYGSANAWVDHFRITDIIAFAPVKEGKRQCILVGSGKPSVDCVVSRNICHEVPVQVGYDSSVAKENEEITVTDNVVVRANIAISTPPEQVSRANNRVWNEGQPRPTQPECYVRSSLYDPDRANLAIINWPNREKTEVDVGAFLKDGDAFRLMAPTKFFEAPVLEGVVKAGRISVPIRGEFAAFVLMRVDPKQEAFWKSVAARAPKATP